MVWQDIAVEAQQHRDNSIAEVKPAIPDVQPQSPRNVAPKSKQLLSELPGVEITPVPDQEFELPLNVTTIPKTLLSDAEVKITESTPENLVSSLASGKLSAVEVTVAFLRRAGIAQKLANCITELLPSRALERAQYLDEYLAEHQKPVGPLHGLPISVKEHIGMKGLGLNAGFVSWWDRKAEDDAGILKILWEAGCVFYARTTQPQTLMHLETSNNLYGETVCPFNTKLTSGGSSGGEGALLGLRGSCLGIGTDIGGSIRSPAANNGVYGLRPTSYRLPLAGLEATMLGQEQVVPVIGPLSTTLDGIKLFMKTLIDSKPWLKEAMLLPFPWRDDITHLDHGKGKKLKVGVIWDDGIVKPHPPVIRAISEVVSKLKEAPDIEVVDWKPYKHDEAWEIIARLYFCDGGSEETEAINSTGEPWRPLSEFILKENPHVKKLSIPEVWAMTVERDMYRNAHAQVWNDTATVKGPDGVLEGVVDCILCPVGPGAAPPLNQARYWGYTAQWNILDYPALIFPVTKVDPEVDLADASYSPRNEKDEFNHKLYDPEVYKGAPVSLQLVGRRYDDEKIIEALEFMKLRQDYLSRASFDLVLPSRC